MLGQADNRRARLEGEFLCQIQCSNQDLGQFLVVIFMHVSPNAPEISGVTGVISCCVLGG